MEYTTLIDADALQALVSNRDPKLVLLDCRFDLADAGAGRRAYGEAHLPGARYADLNRDLAAPPTLSSGRHPLPSLARLTAFCAGAGIGDDSQVVAYDESNGAFAARAWWLLKWLGHDRSAVLDGGFRAWRDHGGAVESGDPPPAAAPGAFTARRPLVATVDVQAVLSALTTRTRLVVDARAPERFAGIVEPIDPVAGHVPGAINHPFAVNLQADGRFLPPDELRHRWRERIGGCAPQEIILMCGSGVTACHNALAMHIANLPGAALYAGSWSEWIRDPTRPVAGPTR